MLAVSPDLSDVAQVALSCTDITVQFGEFTALDGVSLAWAPSSINVVVGQNGAGKTTLARVLGGLQHPSSGRVQRGDRQLPLGDVHEARRSGIEIVHQHFSLPATFTVAEALELFNEQPRTAGLYSRRALNGQTARLLTEAGLSVRPDDLIGDLPVESLQALEITRALTSNPAVLILDEPTAVLAPPAIRQLFDRVHELADRGICVILVLHKLSEVYEIAQSVSALRNGRLVMPPTPIAQVERRDLTRTIVGQSFATATVRPAAPESRNAVLALREVTAQSPSRDAELFNATIELVEGEILGVAGVEGNGQRSLVETLVGITTPTQGRVTLGDEDVTLTDVRSRRERGVRVIPFDRNTEGVSLTSSLWENHAMLRQPDSPRSPAQKRDVCRVELDRWQVRYTDVNQRTGSLSGGNIQKTVLARELTGEVRCLVAAHPTRGLDIAATVAVRSAVVEAAERRAAVLLVSSDLDELFALSHRLLVMRGGRVVAEFQPPFDIEEVGWAMTSGGSE